MIRQAHTYLVGAMSGVTLIAIAIAVFVVLVSAQVFRDWPIAALGGGDETGAVSKAQPAAGSGAGVAAGSGAEAGSPGANGARKAGGPAANAGGGSVSTDTVEVASGGSHGAEPAGSGGKGAGSESSPAQGPGPSGRSAGSNPAGSGGGSGGGGGGTSSNTTSSTSGQITGTVNSTVSQVDETALGGTLNNTGVAGVTEGVVGPESTVGHVVDETAGAAGGLLYGNH